ncbi:MAG: hypothetical protein A4E49_00815 [Methanosaeta sp. PtaU1.Bin112]|nr:MAG: hypothetical protein A4E49_00815 [Methanosaeta sp. PtaU1.Bin112]
MRKILALVLLLALCIPAMAIELPDMKGNWSGVMDFVGYDKNTAWMPNETVSYWPNEEWSLTITEQQGRSFSGTMVPGASPLSKEVVLGVLCSENESITMVDENGYWWGDVISPTEIELNYQEIDMDGMVTGSGVFKKE